MQMFQPPQGVAEFLEMGKSLFAKDPNWVPPLSIMLKDQFSPKSPFFQHAEVVLFVARKNGELVGRCSAQIDRQHLARYNDDTGFFGFLDTVDDQEVVEALLSRARAWLKEKGMKRLIGPMNLSINQEIGTLIEGFDTPPMVMMPHSLPYQDRINLAAGLSKCKDMYAWRWQAQPAMKKRSLRALSSMKDMGVVFRSANLKTEIEELLEIQEDAWRHNWNHVSMTAAEAKQLKKEFQLILDPSIVIVIEIDKKLAGMAIAVPNLNEAIRDFEGKLTPVTLMKLLWRLKVSRPKSARVAMLGIREAYRKQKKYMPLALALIAELNRRGYQRGYEWGELSWTLEDNAPVNAMIKAAGGEIYKKYRVYEQPID